MKAAEEYLKPYHLSYKDSSDRDSYSSYREGYSDAMDIAGQAIKQAQKDAYNQALDDCLKHVVVCQYEWFDRRAGEWRFGIPTIDEESILKLKK